MQGDQVLVEVEPPKADGRRMGRIVRVLERRNPTVVGDFHYARPGPGAGAHTVVPFDERMTQPILIPAARSCPQPVEAATPHRVLGAKLRPQRAHDNLEGLVVDVEITSWPTPTRPPVGRVIEVLGRSGRLRRRRGDDDPQAPVAAHLSGECAGRGAQRGSSRPLRGCAATRFSRPSIVTIDGETARDFDDAVLVTERATAATSCRSTLPTWPSMCARERTWTWRRACAEPASTFPIAPFPCCRRSFPPDICSLRPGEDRLVLSCIMQLDPDGPH